jgi:hypothetical protein
VTLRFSVTVDVAGLVSPVPDADLWVTGNRRLVTGYDGSATITLSFGRLGRYRMYATDSEYSAARATLSVVRR